MKLAFDGVFERASEVLGSLGNPRVETLSHLREAVGILGRAVRAGYEPHRIEVGRFAGIAFEGWALGATLRDRRDGGRRVHERLERRNEDEAVRALLAAGAGMAFGLRGSDREAPAFSELPEPLEAAAWDGYAFQRTLLEPFRARGSVRLGGPSAHRSNLQRGAGRALYFLYAGDVEGLRARIDETREPAALVCGVGVASVFAGGAPPELIDAFHAHRDALETGRRFGTWLATRIEQLRVASGSDSLAIG